MDNIPKITGLDKDDQTERGRSRSRTATSLRPTTGDPAYEPSPAQALYAQQPQISQFLMIPQGPLTAGALSSEHLEMNCIAKDDYRPHQLGSHFFELGARCRHCGECVIPANTLLSMEVIRKHLDSCDAIPNIIRNGKKFYWKSLAFCSRCNTVHSSADAFAKGCRQCNHRMTDVGKYFAFWYALEGAVRDPSPG